MKKLAWTFASYRVVMMVLKPTSDLGPPGWVSRRCSAFTPRSWLGRFCLTGMQLPLICPASCDLVIYTSSKAAPERRLGSRADTYAGNSAFNLESAFRESLKGRAFQPGLHTCSYNTRSRQILNFQKSVLTCSFSTLAPSHAN